MSPATPLAAFAATLAMPAPQMQTPRVGPDPEDSIVVTASRTGADAGVSVAGREAIARRQPATLLDILDELPGVNAFQTGGPAGGSFLTVRGGEPNFTTVLIDGVRLNDPTNSAGGAFDFTLLDPLVVDRIELAPTAASAIHGSDALSGAVQIITRDPAAAGIRPGAQGWIDSRYGGAASTSLAAGWKSGGLIAAGGHYDSGDGDPAGTVRRDQVFGHARQSVGSVRVAAIGLYATRRGTGFPEDSGGPLLAIERSQERIGSDLSLVAVSAGRDPAAKLRPSVSLAWSVQHGDNDAPPIAPGVLDGVPATTAQDRFARLEGIGALAGDIGSATLSIGGAVLRENGRSAGSLDLGFPLPVSFEMTRVTHSGFAEVTVRGPAGLTLDGAVRYDKLQGGSGNWTSRGGLRWLVASNGSRLFAHIANGYKRPSLYALGHPLIGNPTLASETSRSIDAGLEVPLRRGRVSVTVFDNRFRNLIDFDAASFRLVNRARVGARGVEGAMSLGLGGGWSAAGALTYLSLDSATPLRGRPEWSGNLRLVWVRGLWRADAMIRGNSDVNDSAIPTGPRTTPGHVEGDAGLTYQATDHIAMRLGLRNIGDNRSWNAVGTKAPGRSVRLSVQWQ